MSTHSPVKIWRNQPITRRYLGKSGVIVSYTIIRVPPLGYEPQAPYPVVLVDLGREMLCGQLVDYEPHHLQNGQKVQAILRKVKEPGSEGIIPYGIKFKPV